MRRSCSLSYTLTPTLCSADVYFVLPQKCWCVAQQRNRYKRSGERSIKTWKLPVKRDAVRLLCNFSHNMISLVTIQLLKHSQIGVLWHQRNNDKAKTLKLISATRFALRALGASFVVVTQCTVHSPNPFSAPLSSRLFKFPQLPLELGRINVLEPWSCGYWSWARA